MRLGCDGAVQWGIRIACERNRGGDATTQSDNILMADNNNNNNISVLIFVAGWRHALWSEWPFIIIIINFISTMTTTVLIRIIH